MIIKILNVSSSFGTVAVGDAASDLVFLYDIVTSEMYFTFSFCSFVCC